MQIEVIISKTKDAQYSSLVPRPPPFLVTRTVTGLGI